MGKTPEKLRLVIEVDPDWITRPEIVELVVKGHTIQPTAPGVHLILSRNAYMWDDKMWDLFDLPLKAARARKKGLASDSQD